jgi:serine/threonine protein kinase
MTDLISAIKEKNLEQVKEILESLDLESARNLVNQKVGDEYPLFVAYLNSTQIVKFLIDLKIDGEYVTYHERELLLFACNNGNEKIVEILLSREDIDINASNDAGHTSLIAACHKGRDKILELLLNHKNSDGDYDVDVNAVTKDGDSGLMYAAYKGHTKIAELLLQHKDINVNYKTDKGSALKIAIDKKHYEIVELLLKYPDLEINKQNVKSLFLREKFELVKEMIRHKNFPKDEWLQMFSLAGKLDLIELLLSEHPDIDINSRLMIGGKALDDGYTALMFACNKKGYPNIKGSDEDYLKIIKFLVERGADINIKSDKGIDALAVCGAYNKEGYEYLSQLMPPVRVSPPASDGDADTSINYKIIKELGSGANGAVFLVEDDKKEQYALKTIAKHDKNGKVKKTIYSEIMLKELGLKHENIIEIKSYKEEEKSFIIFYKYVPSSYDLMHIIKQRSNEAFTSVFIQKYVIAYKLIKAIEFLKDNNIIHGDIKPQNILIDTDNDRPYLIDFDISCEFFDRSDERNANKKHQNCYDRHVGGTPNYISPAVLKNGKMCNASDIYSMGYTLLVFFLGIVNPPWGSSTVDGIYKKKKEGYLQIKNSKVYYNDTPTSINVELCNFSVLRKKFETMSTHGTTASIKDRNELVECAYKLDERAVGVLNTMMSNITDECISYKFLYDTLEPIITDVRMCTKFIYNKIKK